MWHLYTTDAQVRAPAKGWALCPMCAPAWLNFTEHVCAAQLFHGLLGLGQVGGGD